tara:strand:- start:927 stop:1139 length:213 start_codon:yes stop_codon:yes gene_type:complete
MSYHLTQKSIFDKEQGRKDSQKQSGKTSRQLRREAAKKKKCGLEPARAPASLTPDPLRETLSHPSLRNTL